jgi:UDP-N-acetylglucosamine 2-epimerase (non-hydrolysing)/GDP/UDP-N,N'-diacetylbacillosamine 2-epimerase (hydrolysing)
MGVAVAALLAQIPIAHIHGGEVTEGAVDDAIRHALTKLSTWHFVAAEPYRQRVIQLGEAPDRVFNVGAPGLDVLHDFPWMDEAALGARLNLPLKGPLLLVTYHPETLDVEDPAQAFARLLAALEQVADAEIVITYPNADTHNQRLIPLIEGFAARYADRVRAVRNLGQLAYLSTMRRADAVVGNSSSGLTEAPALKRPTVNVGHRQDGRLKADSVIDVECEPAAIAAAIARALSPDFQRLAAATHSPYGEGDASGAILNVLKGPLPPRRKSFFDIAHSH